MCFYVSVRDPVIKRGGLGYSYQEGRVGTQLSRGEGWDTGVKICCKRHKIKNISVISWRSVLLVEETGGSGENHQSVASH